MDKIGLWKGKPISEMSHKDLLKTITEMRQYYEKRLKEKDDIYKGQIDFLRQEAYGELYL